MRAVLRPRALLDLVAQHECLVERQGTDGPGQCATAFDLRLGIAIRVGSVRPTPNGRWESRKPHPIPQRPVSAGRYPRPPASPDWRATRSSSFSCRPQNAPRHWLQYPCWGCLVFCTPPAWCPFRKKDPTHGFGASGRNDPCIDARDGAETKGGNGTRHARDDPQDRVARLRSVGHGMVSSQRDFTTLLSDDATQTNPKGLNRFWDAAQARAHWPSLMRHQNAVMSYHYRFPRFPRIPPLSSAVSSKAAHTASSI